MQTLYTSKMLILLYDHEHYLSMSQLQTAMVMSDVLFQQQLELYSYQCKSLKFINSDNEQCISCKSAVMFLKWFLDQSYRTHPEINSLKHELAKWAKKIPKRKLSRSLRIELAYRQQYKCRMCVILLPPDFEVDHIQALEDGGEDIASNLQCLCVPCHKTKSRLNRLRKTVLFSEEAEVQHEAYAKPFDESDRRSDEKPDEKLFSKYFSQYQKN